MEAIGSLSEHLQTTHLLYTKYTGQNFDDNSLPAIHCIFSYRIQKDVLL